MSRLQKIAEEYNVAVFITNQMTSDPGATMSFQVLIYLVYEKMSIIERQADFSKLTLPG